MAFGIETERERRLFASALRPWRLVLLGFGFGPRFDLAGDGGDAFDQRFLLANAISAGVSSAPSSAISSWPTLVSTACSAAAL